MTKQHKDWLWAFSFIAPTVIGLYVFFIIPMFSSIYLSLTQWNHLTTPVFVGIANYKRLFTDKIFWTEMGNTFFFVLFLVPLTLCISLFLANALNSKRIKMLGFARISFFLPYIVLPVVTAMTWLIMFNSRFGLINALLGIIHLPQVSWLNNAWLARCIIIILSLWASIGYYGIIILAGLQNIGTQYYEACELEGGNWWHKFRHITFPLVTPQLFFCLVLSIISVFKMFDYIFIFGKGNVFLKDSIRTMAFGIYENGFTYMEMGYASAEAIVLAVLVLAVTIFQNIGQKKWVFYN
jgi:multiple sugar transport system permease protein